MTTEALKSTSITNLDATPKVVNTTGKGGDGLLKHINDSVTVSASMGAGSTYKLARIPSNAVVKDVIWEAEAMAAGKFNVGLYYSDSTIDGTPPSVQGTALDDDFFATDIDCAAAVAKTNITNESGTYTIAKRNQPIWQAAGLSSDPGGFFDVVATIHTTDVTTGAAKISTEVRYIG